MIVLNICRTDIFIIVSWYDVLNRLEMLSYTMVCVTMIYSISLVSMRGDMFKLVIFAVLLVH